MTPKEKAEDLFSTYRYALSIPNVPLGELKDDVAKKCALIAVDEIMQSLTVLPYGIKYLSHIDYLEEVKQEIKKL